MNGRVYDYNLGRFMSVDPFIQSPSSTQSVNPYSYIMNNPLAGTDPTGYNAILENRGMNILITIISAREEFSEQQIDLIAQAEESAGNSGARDAAENGKLIRQASTAGSLAGAAKVVKAGIEKSVERHSKNSQPKIKNGASPSVKAKDGKLSDIGKPSSDRAGGNSTIQGPPDMVRGETDGRHEPDGKPGPRVKVIYPDGAEKDITSERVKEKIVNTHPNARSKDGSVPKNDVKKMENPLNKDGSKREPDDIERELLKNNSIRKE